MTDISIRREWQLAKLSTGIQRYIILAFTALLILQVLGVSFAGVSGLESRIATNNTPQWREASPTRVIIRSTADWGRILFDDLNGTDSNGIRIKSVIGIGWLEGRDPDDQLQAGRKVPWPDTEYNTPIVRRGDMVAFFKGLRDFHYTEAYADVTLEINIDLPRVYVWLMTGGNGTTTFEIVSRDTGGTIWRDIVVGAGQTEQVKRVMSTQPFFRTGRAETTIVVAWLSVVIVAMIVLNFPILEVLRKRLRRRRDGPQHETPDHHGKARKAAKGATEQK